MDREAEKRDKNRSQNPGHFAQKLTALAALALLLAVSPGRAEVVDRIVANVNGSIILLSEVQDQLAAMKDLKTKQGMDIPAEKLTEKGVLSEIIDEKLVTSFAKEKEIEIKESEVDKAVQGIKDRNKLSDEEFKMVLSAQGASMDKFRERVKNQILIQKVISQEVDTVAPTEEEARAFYEQNKKEFSAEGKVRARHILIMAPEDATSAQVATAEQKIVKIKERIDAGADFGQMAKENSEDPSASNGGDLGWFGRGEVLPAFEKVAFAMEIGRVSAPVRTSFGYHLIQVTEKEQAVAPAFDKVADRIKDALSRQSFEKRRNAWLDRMREQAFIEIMY